MLKQQISIKFTAQQQMQPQLRFVFGFGFLAPRSIQLLYDFYTISSIRIICASIGLQSRFTATNSNNTCIEMNIIGCVLASTFSAQWPFFMCLCFRCVHRFLFYCLLYCGDQMLFDFIEFTCKTNIVTIFHTDSTGLVYFSLQQRG